MRMIKFKLLILVDRCVCKDHSLDLYEAFFVWNENILPFIEHIFQNAQVTSNQMVRKTFLAQFWILFHMMWSFLLQVFAQKTPYDLLKFYDSQSEASIQWFLSAACLR